MRNLWNNVYCLPYIRVELLLAEWPSVAAGSAPEWMSEKAVSIGTYFVASGVFTHLGIVPPVLGSQKVTKLLTEDIEDLIGGKFYVEPDPVKAAETIYNVVLEKRKKLGLP